MGLDIHFCRFLLGASKQGVSFERVLMLGRQSLAVTAAELSQVFEEGEMTASRFSPEKICQESPGYSEGFFRALGAKEVVSMDASSYEGAEYVHDLNLPIPQEWKGRFTAVVDGGSLEHVFHFPQAIRNVMELVSPGGCFVTATTANNFMGHGFYQFSPELFYLVFTPENGYAVEHLFLREVRLRGSWYRASDPEKIRRRVTLANTHPTYLMMVARRERIESLFEKWPQQSDYAARWDELPNAEARLEAKANFKIRLKNFLPKWARRLWQELRLWVCGIITPRPPVYDPQGYSDLDDVSISRGKWE